MPTKPQTYKDALKVVEGLKSGVADQNKKFYDGDHWQDGEQWIGPKPSNNKRLALVMAEIEKGFVSHNTIKEVVGRCVSGLIGKEAVWRIGLERAVPEGESPSDAEQEQIDIAEAMLTNWWDEKGVLRLAQDAMARMLLGRRCCLRMYIPQGRLMANVAQSADGAQPEIISYSLAPKTEPQKALDDLFLHVVDWDQGAVATDSWNMMKFGVYVAEDPETKKKILETSDVSNGMTTITMTQDADSETRLSESIALDLLGNLPMKMISLDSEFVSPQMVQQQNLQNLSLTMLARNVVLGGFLERVLINAQMPGKWVPDSDSPGGEKFVPTPIDIGAGVATNLVGIETESDDGKKTLSTPSIQYREPVTVTTFAETVQVARTSILEEASQLHVAMSGDATSSGESRIQARADFASLLVGMKPEIDGLVRWILETALAFGKSFLGEGVFQVDGLSAMSNVTVNTGPLSLEERKLVIEMMEKGKISEESGMAMLGVEDVDFEKTMIRSEWKERLLTPEDASKLGIPPPVPDQLPDLEERMGIPKRDIEAFKAELTMQADERALALKEASRAMPNLPGEDGNPGGA